MLHLHIHQRSALLLCLVAACQAPTDADRAVVLEPSVVAEAAPEISPTSIIKVVKPSLVTTACVNGSNQLEVTETWFAQTTVEQPLTLTLYLKRPQTGTEVVPRLVLGPYDPQPAFVTFVLVPYIGAPWDTFPSIGASATGAFTDTAPTLRQPKSGWPTC